MTVVTGFIGRDLLAQLGRARRGRRSELASLRAAFLEEPAAPTQADTAAPPLSGWTRYLFVAGDASEGQRHKAKAGIAGALAAPEFAHCAEETSEDRLVGTEGGRTSGFWRSLSLYKKYGQIYQSPY